MTDPNNIDDNYDESSSKSAANAGPRKSILLTEETRPKIAPPDERKKSVIFENGNIGAVLPTNAPIRNIRINNPSIIISRTTIIAPGSRQAIQLAKSLDNSKEVIENWDHYIDDAAIEFRQSHKRKSCADLTIYDFELLTTLHQLEDGVLALAQSNFGLGAFAINILSKEKLVNGSRIKFALNEKRISTTIKCSFVARCYFFFQDFSYLYYVTPFLPGGDLYTRLQRVGKLSENEAAFIAAQLVLALEYLHTLNLVHRDVKPENIYIDKNGFIKLSGYKLAKLLDSRTYTVCGTPEYLAPEIILGQGYGKSVDWWALGVTIFELCSGKQPFGNSDKMKMFACICDVRYRELTEFSKSLKSLLQGLMVADISRRLGNMVNGISEIKNHRWFSSIEWAKLINKNCVPAYVPSLSSPTDVKYYSEIKEETILFISGSNSFGNAFKDF